LNNYAKNPLASKSGLSPESYNEAYQIYLDGLHYVPPDLRLSPQVLKALEFFETIEPRAIETQPKETPFSYLQSKRANPRLSFYDLGNPYDQGIQWDPQVCKESLDKPLDLFSSFAHYYMEAKEAKNDLSKLHLCTRLHFYPIEKRPFSWNVDSHFLLALIHFALLHPKTAPALPAVGTDPKSQQSQLEWLKNAYRAFRALHETGEPEPLPSLKAEPQIVPPGILNSLPTPPLRKNNSQPLPPLPKIADRSPLQLAQMAEKFFISQKPKESPSSYDFTKAIVNRPQFKGAIQRELADFQDNYREGVRRRRLRRTYVLKRKGSLPDLKLVLETQTSLVKRLENEVFDLVGKRAPSKASQLYDTSLFAGGVMAQPSMELLVSYFLEGDAALYATLNPHLNETDIQALDSKLYEYLRASADLAQGERAATLMESLSDGENNRASKIHQLAQSLRAPIAHDGEREFLVFEHRSGLRLRENQVKLIRRMQEIDPHTQEYRAIVAQLMMGEGKTSVIASILLELTVLSLKKKEPRRKAVFIAPSAQFESLRTNLAMLQKKHYLKEVIPVDLERSQMTTTNLGWLFDKLQELSEEGNVLLIKAEGLQSLQLEFLSLLMQKSESFGDTKDLDCKIIVLRNLLTSLASSGDGIIDEVDVVLAPHKMVNFPIGSQRLLPPPYVLLLLKIVSLHVSDQMVEQNGKEKSIASLLGLREKRGAGIDLDFYKETIQPLLVEALFRANASDFQIPTNLEESFKRFVLGKINPPDLTVADQEFVDYLKGLYNSESGKEASQLISLAKGIFTKILPAVINKEVNQNFGRTRGKPAGKVVPFLGADAPAHTEFGNPWEAALFHFFTALRCGIDASQIQVLAETMSASAEHKARKGKQIFDDTLDAKEFLALTDVPLSKIHEKGNLEKATLHVNSDLNLMLLTEAETICRLVGYYDEYLSSNAQNLSDQMATERTFSGTPSYRLPSYPSALKSNCQLDVGVEGEIADQLLTTCDTILTCKKEGIGDILKNAIESGIPKKQLKGFIDAAGLLKDCDMKEVAREVSELLGLNVLFFGRKNPSDITPDDLMVWKKGQTHPEFIGSTQKDVLLKHEIDPSNTFVIYDERHCEATDIAQEGDAINLLTLNETVPSRTLFQAALRLRQFFEGQKVALLIPEEARKKMPNQGQTVFDVLLGSVICQAIHKASESEFSYKQKIDHVRRQEGVRALYSFLEDENLSQMFGRFKTAFVQNQVLDPYLQYGSVETWVPTIQVIEKRITEAKKQGADSKQLSQLLQDARENPFLSELSPQAEGASEPQMGIHCENQVEVQVEIELEQSLQNELSYYSSLNADGIYLETDWDKSLVDAPEFPKIVPMPSCGAFPSIWTLPNLLGHFKGPKPRADVAWVYHKPYHEIFDDTVLISDNLGLTKNHHLPVFHPAQKSADQHLVICKAGKPPRVLMLSIADAAFFKKYLEETSRDDLWLIHPDGREISIHDHKLLTEDEQRSLDRTLLQVQIFRGDARNLDQKEKETHAFLAEGNRELKLAFLKLKVEKNREQRAIFYQMIARDGKGSRDTGSLQCVLASGKEEAARRRIQKLKDAEIGTVLPEEIQYLAPRQVGLLKAAHQIAALQKHQVNDLVPKQIPFIADELIPLLSNRQTINCVPYNKFRLLKCSQITKLDAPYLSGLFRAENPKFQEIFSSLSQEQIAAVIADRELKGETVDFFGVLESSQVKQLSIRCDRYLSVKQIREKYSGWEAVSLLCVGLMMQIVRVFAYLFGAYILRTRVFFFRNLCKRLDEGCLQFTSGYRRLRGI
jgi:hypothetical protein